MLPEDVLMEAMAAASIYGDSDRLRHEMVKKHQKCMERCGFYYPNKMREVLKDDGTSPFSRN